MPNSFRLSPRNAREAAVLALATWRLGQGWSTDSLESVLRQADLPERERGFAKELVLGVVRRQATLDAILKHLVTRDQNQVEPPLWGALQLGLYQLVFLDHVPPHAAVHETVEAAKRMGRMGWGGIVNGVLREASRNLLADIVDTPGRSSVPLSPGRFRLLAHPWLPDPVRQFDQYVAIAYSLPLWLVQRWFDVFGRDRVQQLAEQVNLAPPMWIRTNIVRATPESLRQAFAQVGITSEPGPFAEAFSVVGAGLVNKLPGFDQGWFAVQDLTAMHAARLLAPQPNESIWDVCAAPGGKTCHLAEIMGGSGTILATDVNVERLARVRENADRLGHANITTRVIPPLDPALTTAEDQAWPTGPFDGILIDAPCSNTGVLARRAEARWRLTPRDLEELPRIQRALVQRASRQLRSGGRLVYSTCSIEPEENVRVIDGVLQVCPDLTLLESHLHFPGDPADGGYQALLVRR